MTEANTRIRTLLDELAHEARLDPRLERRTLRRARRHRTLNVAAILAAITVVIGLGAVGVRQVAKVDVPAIRPPAPHVAEVPACTGSGLRARPASQTGAAGIIRTEWRFTNVSGSTCRISGYPAIAFHVGGRWVSATVTRGGYPDIERSPTTVRVRPGRAASLVTYWSDVTTTAGSCLTFDEVQLAPPGILPPIRVQATGCVDPSHVFVGPITRDRRG